MHFEQLGLIEPLLKSVLEEGYTTPTTIQEQAIPTILQGRDIFGCAQTGTGKTAAFALPILQKMFPYAKETPKKNRHGKSTQCFRPIRALILAPTRELAAQVNDSLATYGRYTNIRSTVIFGGVSQYKQVQALKKGTDILVATPGRLFDLINQKHVHLDHIEVFVLDEADRMLDMGFIHDIKRVVEQLPAERQNLMFSATLPQAIRTLAASILKDPVTLEAQSQDSPAAETVRQSLYYVEQHHKPVVLEHLLKHEKATRAIVFTRTKRRADRVAEQLERSEISAEAIHSDKSQNARTKALNNFKRGTTRVLVASDIASRGIDVDQISHVFNYDLPNEAETYVHRIGRTGRAGESGHAISFCCGDQKSELKDIERLLGKAIPVQKHSLTLPKHTPENSDRPARSDRSTHSERPARSERPTHSDRPASSERPARSERPTRSERPAHSERPTRSESAKPAARHSSSEKPTRSFGRKNEHRSEGRPGAGDRNKKSGARPQHGKPRSTRSR